jgi:hypothetical protein
MKYATPAAFRTALEQRLVTTATQTGAPVARLRKLVALDALARRLSREADRHGADGLASR